MIWNIKCILYDFDGVMTDNRVVVDENGMEGVFVNRSDGLAISLIRKMGIGQAIVSTEKNPVVKRRAEKLNLEVIYGVCDKGEAVKQYCEIHGFDLANTMFIGNDLNDIPAMLRVGVKGCPWDAYPEIRQMADWISLKKGGYGVIRDLYDWLKCRM